MINGWLYIGWIYNIHTAYQIYIYTIQYKKIPNTYIYTFPVFSIIKSKLVKEEKINEKLFQRKKLEGKRK